MAEFVLGTVQLGLPYGAANATGLPSTAEAEALLTSAASAGVRWLDTARAYGEAEARIGGALRLPTCGSLSVVTKLAPLDGIAANDAEAAVIAAKASLENSHTALGLEVLPVVLLHRGANRTAWNGDVWAMLRAERDRGRIGCLGISAQTPAEAVAAALDEAVGHIQLPFNIVDWRWRDAMAALDRRPDIVLHVRSVFLQGLLVAGPAVWPRIAGVDPEEVCRILQRLSERLGRSGVDDLCLAYVRGCRRISGVVIGLETCWQLERNLALFARPPLTDEECAQVRDALPRLPEQLLNPALWPRGSA